MTTTSLCHQEQRENALPSEENSTPPKNAEDKKFEEDASNNENKNDKTDAVVGVDDGGGNRTNNSAPFVRSNVKKEICREVVRKKLAKQRHLVVKGGIDPAYLDELFPRMLSLFEPQIVHYNGGVANVKEWKISCYLEVMDGGVPTTNPNLGLRNLFLPLLDGCDDLFLHWYRQQQQPARALTTTTTAQCALATAS